MSRKLSDRRVAKVLAAFDRVMASPVRQQSIDDGDYYLCYFMQGTTLSICHGYLVPGGWTTKGARAVLATWLTQCPVKYLAEAMVAAAKEVDDVLRDELEDGEQEQAAA
jgi:hypothetical protein